ncbi:MAG TPA: TIGR03619 family F420-dependent LLM class oxidoreductase [Acidimicrobiales bacterium]|nr:TIGR03619 family F420-dependent LLM class oxidoreductase [Acidimicrobiales bacterium]
MDLGLFGINMNVLAARPAAALDVARAAEAAGWDSVWTGEHYVLPDPRAAGSPAPPETPMLDPFVALAAIAACTSTLRVATGVTVVPVHHPIKLAKQVASLDRLSGGRFLFGVGAGYLAAEFAALDVPLAGRGARMDDHLAAMRALWTQAPAAHDGTHSRFSAVRAEPRPVQQPGPPLHVGGYAARSYERAVTQGQGWYGFALGPEATEACVAALRRALDEHDRPDDLGPLQISVTPDPRLDLDDATLAAYAALGVTRLIPLGPWRGREEPDAIIRFVDDLAARVARHPDLAAATGPRP